MSEAKELAVSYKIGDNEIKLTPSIVQNYIVGSKNATITNAEFKMFTELCKVRKLNPFLKQAYCIKYGTEPATIVVGKDVILERAIIHPMYDGKETGIIVQKEDGTIEERQGCFFAPKETVIGGWARVYRKDKVHPEYMSVSVAEVAGKKGNELNYNWKSKTATMVEKVAKVRALRESFIDEFQGMYEAEEFNTELPTLEPQEPIGQELTPDQKANAIEAEPVSINDLD